MAQFNYSWKKKIHFVPRNFRKKQQPYTEQTCICALLKRRASTILDTREYIYSHYCDCCNNSNKMTFFALYETPEHPNMRRIIRKQASSHRQNYQFMLLDCEIDILVFLNTISKLRAQLVPFLKQLIMKYVNQENKKLLQ